MKRSYLIYVFLLAGWGAAAVEVAGTPRDSNIQNTAGYDGTRIEAQLMVNVQDKTQHLLEYAMGFHFYLELPL